MANNYENLCGCPSCQANRELNGDSNSNNEGNVEVLYSTSIFDLSQPDYINSLLLGYSWGGEVGEPATLTYTFDATTSYAATNYDSELMGAYFEDKTREALEIISRYVDVTFVEDTSPTGANADIYFSQADLPGWSGVTLPWRSGVDYIQSEVILDVNSAGDYLDLTILHELGHALGLAHPHSGDFILDSSRDSYNTSLMSYVAGEEADYSHLPITPMIYDIAALQYLYGANMDYNTGNDSYGTEGIGENGASLTIWDAGGEDILDSSWFSGDVTLDLREGEENFSLIDDTYIWIAFDADIENATAGSGNDNIFGNDLTNTLYGGSGEDTMYGFEGDDYLQGNAGNDVEYGGAGNDTIVGGKNDDLLYGEEDNDTLFGHRDNDTLWGNEGDDMLYGGVDADYQNGNMGNDTLYGENGDDILRGGRDNDTVYGGDGNDSIYGDKHNDLLYGEAGADSFYFWGASGNDTIADFETGIDSFVISGSYGSAEELISHTSISGSNLVVDLGGGNTVTLIGVTSLTASDIDII